MANRDAVDTRVLDYVTAGTTSPTAYLTTAGPFPVLDAGTPCADGDGDGMPDLWEDAHGLAKLDASDRNGIRASASGYTNLELYLSGLFPNGTPLPTRTISIDDVTALEGSPSPSRSRTPATR